jgi:lysine biosynthesis protein LysW
MPKAYCPSCDAVVVVDKPRVGGMVTCRECAQELEIISLNPFEVDYPLDEEWDDDDDEEDEDDGWREE